MILDRCASMDDAYHDANLEAVWRHTDEALTCEISLHPNHERCARSASFKIMGRDTVCNFWTCRVACLKCTPMAWLMTVEGRYCACSSEHVSHSIELLFMMAID